ncbi:MAG: 50S ribosomal protein L10 [Treponema sp.]|jgi:large subunit ribosomal protein L10|nr:50S ribosomal protein L10 [Treponema sp.]
MIVAKTLQEGKVAAVDTLQAAFGTSADFIFADYRGMTVEQLTALRKQLRAKDARFRVVKNTSARLAFERRAAPDVSGYLTGPTAIAIAPKDANEVAKLLFQCARETPALKVKGGLVGDTVYNAAQVEAFSRLPAKGELIAMLLSVMNGPARNLAAALNDIPARLVRTIKAVGDQKAAEAEGTTPA